MLPSIRVRSPNLGFMLGSNFIQQGVWAEVTLDFWKHWRLAGTQYGLEWDVSIPSEPIHSPYKMRVIVPYANVAPYILRPETIERMTGIAEFIDTSQSGAYWDTIVRLWREQSQRGQGFCLVEHDMVPELQQLAELDNCTSDWCGIPFPENYMNGACGCCRYSAELVERLPDIPDAMEEIALTHLSSEHTKILLADGHPMPHHHYSIVTGMLDRALNNEGVHCHAHKDHVLVHLREFP